MGLSIGVVGATGAVGRNMMTILEERKIDIETIRCFASKRTAGETLEWKGQQIIVELLTEEAMKESFDYLLFSAGGSVSEQYAAVAQAAGNTIIDNSSAWRMTAGVPLAVPEVNAHVLKEYHGIVANPNCSTIQMVVALAPLHREYGIKRIVVSTYQAVSGSGHKAIVELENQLNDPESMPQVYPKKIAGNCLPHIDVFNENGFTKEELKMVYETQKILEDDTIEVNATAVRVPVVYGHSESITVTFRNQPELSQARELLTQAPGVVLMDDPAHAEYPTPLMAAGTDDTFVGRLRNDLYDPYTLSMWVVADNLRKGAATNAVQILQKMEELKMQST